MIGHKLLYGAAAFMAVGFCIHLTVDWYQYSSTLNSAPFWVWAVTDGLLWLLPAAVACIAGAVAKKKLMKKEKRK